MIKRNITIALILVGLIYFLSQVFSGAIILPQFILLGPITIRYYGLFMALAVASGFYLAIKKSSYYGVTTKQAEDILFYSIIGGFIGARLYHVLSSFSYYAGYPLDIFKVWNGGLSIYGVVFGGIISLFIYLKLTTYNLQLTTLLNWLTPSLILGQIIGRFGNLFNYELYGYPTNLPWKMFVPVEFKASEFTDYNFFHPLFLYEQIGLIMIALIIGKIRKSENPMNPAGLLEQRKSKAEETGVTASSQKMRNNSEKSSGASLFFWYVLLYNVLRILLEFLRIDSVFIGNLRQNALVSLLLIILSGAVLFYRDKRNGSKTS